MNKETWSFIIVAGGTGSRLGGTPKQFRFLAGLPVWKWSAMVAEKLWEEGAVEELLLVVPEDRIAEAEAESCLSVPTRLTAGGATRSESVMNGLRISCGSHVLVHDAARPNLGREDLAQLLERGRNDPVGAILAAPVRDTLKRAGDDGGIDGTEPRERLWRAFTPQLFRRLQLTRALEAATAEGIEVTDEAMAMEWQGLRPLLVEGAESNFKITTPADLARFAYERAQRDR